MRTGLVVVLLVSFAAATAAGADAVVQQPAQGQESAVAAPTTAQQVPTAAAAPKAVVPKSKPAKRIDAATSKPGPSAEAPAEFKVPAGYKAVKRGFDTVYCKNEKPTGSRVPERVCYSREEVEAIEIRAKQDHQTLKQMTRPLGNVNGG